MIRWRVLAVAVLWVSCGGDAKVAPDAMPAADAALVDYGGEVLAWGGARDLIVDGERLIWSATRDDRVMELSLSTGEQSVVSELESPTHLARTTTQLFAIGAGSGASALVALGGDEPVALGADVSECCLASNRSSVFWFDTSGTDRRLMRAGADLVATPMHEDFPLSTSVSASAESLVHHFVREIGLYSLSGGTFTPLHQFTTQRIQAAAVLDDRVIVVTAGDDDGMVSLWSLGLDPGEPILLGAVAGVASEESLAFDDEHIYFVRYDDQDYGGISRIPRGGGEVLELSRRQPRPQAVAVDDAFVYWINLGTNTPPYDPNREGRLMRAPLP